jgi:hypothetical protein
MHLRVLPAAVVLTKQGHLKVHLEQGILEEKVAMEDLLGLLVLM